jgi:hypothetical protein
MIQGNELTSRLAGLDFLDKCFLPLENENMTFHDKVGYGMKK